MAKKHFRNFKEGGWDWGGPGKMEGHEKKKEVRKKIDAKH